MTKTSILDAEQRKMAEDVLAKGKFFSATQEATLKARVRTNRGIGVVVNCGFYTVTESAYARNRKDCASGGASITKLSQPFPCSQPELVVAFLESL